MKDVLQAIDATLFDQVNVYGIEKENPSYVGIETLDTRLGSQCVVHVRNKTSATAQDIGITPAPRNLLIKFTIPAQGMSLVASIANTEVQVIHYLYDVIHQIFFWDHPDG